MRTLSEAVPTSFTGYGPTADGRLKPEVVANGAALHSTIETGDNAYGNSSGTSMATPTVSGIALLLQERHINLFNHPMRASTLKALLMHSADDLGTPGPDYQTGYGLVNAFEAEKIISGQWEQQSAPVIREEVLIANHIDQHEFFVPTLEKITLCWTDPTIRPFDEDNNSQLTSQLEHDLDLRVFAANGQVFQPWILSPANPALPAIFGDNSIDNVEQIVIPTGVAGPFRVVVTSKEPLTFAIPRMSLPPRLGSINSLLASQNNPAGQVFSLILSGADKSTGTIAEALDNTSLKFTIGGANAGSSFNWISQADVTQDGIDAARSSRIRDN